MKVKDVGRDVQCEHKKIKDVGRDVQCEHKKMLNETNFNAEEFSL